MLRIGLTGGIASGKSVASRRFEQLGARVVDHDQLARQAVASGSAALADIVREFGSELAVDGELDRAALGAIVFNDAVAREKLNSIVHPYVYSLARAQDREAREHGVPVIVHAIPLLVETDQTATFELVVTVQTPAEIRVDRLTEGRGLTRDQALARIAAQASDGERAASADVVLDGSGSEIELYEQVDNFWHDHIPVSERRRNVEA